MIKLVKLRCKERALNSGVSRGTGKYKDLEVEMNLVNLKNKIRAGNL